MLSPMAAVPESVARFRDEFRAREVGPYYSGLAHIGFTTLGTLAVIAFAASRLRDVSAWEWLVVPASLAVANFGEYFGHRGPMHHRRPGLGLVHKRHALTHHVFFTSEAMGCESRRDLKIVLFPPVMLVFFLGLAIPIALAFYLLTSANGGWLFIATTTAYFLTYEWLHLAHHLPEGSWVSHVRVLRWLRRHHALHHAPGTMGRCNFNVTFPLADWLMGTLRRGP